MNTSAADALASLVLHAARDTFLANKHSADRGIAQLSDAQLHQRLSPDANSIAIIMAHVAGNLRSRWTDFLQSDGEKSWRHRDREFLPRDWNRGQILADWEDGWRCVQATLSELRADDLLRTVTIRGEAMTVPQAVQRSLAHCGYHVGQILLLGRLLKGDSWQMISIPLGQSEQYNARVWGGSSTIAATPLAASAELPTPTAAPRLDVNAAFAGITYQLEPQLTDADFVDVLERSTLAQRRPVSEPGTMERMLRHADVIVTARHAGKLVGVSRAISDFAFCTYLSDLAVDQAYQKQGIGRTLIDATHQAAGRCTSLILLAAPAARSYYPHIGMQPHDSCWVTWRQP